MFNSAQIKKLQSKVGKKVDNEIRIREEKQKQEHISNMIEIKQQGLKIEQSNPDRGRFICLFDNIYYTINTETNKVIAIPFFRREEIVAFENMATINNKTYYLMHKQTYDFNNRIIQFMSKHYASIKIAVASQKSESLFNKDKLAHMLHLGSIFEEFQKEFPDSSPLLFKQAVNMMDSLISNY